MKSNLREVFNDVIRQIIKVELKEIDREALFDCEKQPPQVFYFVRKRCSYKFPKIHRKTPVPEFLFLINLQALGLQT